MKMSKLACFSERFYIFLTWLLKKKEKKRNSRSRSFAAATYSQEEEVEAETDDLTGPKETIQAVAWLDMMYEESGLTLDRANKAASIIQVNHLNLITQLINYTRYNVIQITQLN